MIFIQGRIGGRDENGMMARLYMAAFANMNLPCRAIFADSMAVEPSTLEPELQIVYDLGLRPLGPVQTLVALGPVTEVTSRQAEAPYNIALTWWVPGRLSRVARKRLAAFNEVWVPGDVLREDLPEAKVVPIPFDRSKWEAAIASALRVGAKGRTNSEPFVFYAIGTWNLGDAKRAFDAYVEAAKSATGALPHRLFLIAPDAPFATESELRTILGCDDSVKLPSISADAAVPGTVPALRALHAIGDCFIGRFGLHATAARAAGNKWLTPDGLLEMGIDAIVGAARDPASSVACSSFEETARWMEDQLARVTVEARPEPEPVAAGTGPLPAIFTFVVPHRDDLDNLKAMLDTLMPQVWPGDEIVVSDQGSTDDVLEALVDLAEHRRLTLVRDQYAGVWSIARARNAGFRNSRNAITMAPRYVMTVDADIRFPEGWLQKARDIISVQHGRETAIFVPRAVDNDGKRDRIASGLSFMPRGILESARGWDEEYLGYGCEDLDCVHRLRHDLGAKLVQFSRDDLEPLVHRKHVPRDAGETYGKAAQSRLEQRVAGKLGRANGPNWGLAGVVLIRDGLRVDWGDD